MDEQTIQDFIKRWANSGGAELCGAYYVQAERLRGVIAPLECE